MGKSLNTNIHRKDTDTGLLTNFGSFTCFKHKIGLIKTLIDRTFKITSSWKLFNKDIKDVKTILKKNNFLPNLINQNIKSYLNDKYSNSNKEWAQESTSRYFKLAYIGGFSSYTEKRIKDIIKRFCKINSSVKLAFTPTKLANFFSTKDRQPDILHSYLIYRFNCTGCNSCYVGNTTRHLCTRIEEHLRTDKNSHILKHLNSSPQTWKGFLWNIRYCTHTIILKIKRMYVDKMG